MSMLVFVVCLFGGLAVLRLIANVRKHTRNMGFGFRVTGPGISEEAQEKRVNRFIKISSAENRAKQEKLARKIGRTRSRDKSDKLFAQIKNLYYLILNDEQVAENVARGKGKFKGHGIRRAGNERGRPVK